MDAVAPLRETSPVTESEQVDRCAWHICRSVAPLSGVRLLAYPRSGYRIYSIASTPWERRMS